MGSGRASNNPLTGFGPDFDLMAVHNIYLATRYGLRREPDPNICCVCGQPLIPGEVYATDKVQRWHPECGNRR